MEDIIIEERQSKIIRRNLLGLMMVVLSTILLLAGVKTKTFFCSLLGGVGIFFWGICTLYSFSRTVKPKALLTITVEGILDSSTAGSPGFISFGDIKSFEIVNVFGQKMIGVNLKRIEQFSEKLPQIKQRSAQSNLKMKLPPITIRVDTARDISIEDILTLLEKRHLDYNRLYD